VKLSCGCTKARLTRETVLPGEVGTLEAEVDLEHKRSAFAENVTLRAEGAGEKDFKVLLCGSALNDTIASVDAIYIGEVPQGQSKIYHFFVHDPGLRILEVRGSRIELPPRSVPNGSLSFARVNAGSPLVGKGGRYPVLEGDYEGTLRMDVPEDAPLGPVTGRAVIATNLSDPMKEVALKLHMVVLSDVEVRPRAVLLSAAGQSASARIKLSRRSGKPLAIVRTTVEGGVPVSVGESERLSSDALRITIAYSGNSLPGRIAEGRVQCIFEDGRALDIPVIVSRGDSIAKTAPAKREAGARPADPPGH
jgi:hypothetical protein